MDAVLEVSQLHKVFPGKRKVHAVNDVSFTVGRGEVVGLLGPNGAGKTTIIKCVLGLVLPTSGSIQVQGKDPQARSSGAAQLMGAVLEGSRNIYWRLTPRANVRFFAGLHGLDGPAQKAYNEELLHKFGLADKADTEVRNLSSGMKQKVAVVCALAKRTPLVFLDEPTLGLDVETSYELRGLLKQLAADEQRTIVVSSHDMDVVQDVCRRVLIIAGGRLIADETVPDLLALFRSRTYRFVLEGRPDLSGLQAAFPQAAVTASGGQTAIELLLPNRADIYRAIDLIREAGGVLESVTQPGPDLEQAFLTLVRRERDNACA